MSALGQRAMLGPLLQQCDHIGRDCQRPWSIHQRLVSLQGWPTLSDRHTPFSGARHSAISDFENPTTRARRMSADASGDAHASAFESTAMNVRKRPAEAPSKADSPERGCTCLWALGMIRDNLWPDTQVSQTPTTPYPLTNDSFRTAHLLCRPFAHKIMPAASCVRDGEDTL